MPGKYLRGALIEFTETFPLPIPNIIMFQYNPETMTHSWTPATTGSPAGNRGNPLAITGDPQEAFSFTLAMDATDMIADGSAVANALATASGVYTRLAALEMLLFPTAAPGGGLIGKVSAALGLTGGGGAPDPATPVPAAQLPTVLFIWGPGRIVPVRVTNLVITERLYDSLLLNPTHAEAQIGLRVLTKEELAKVNGPLAVVARAANTYSHGLREALAIANLANAAESILGMLPL